MGPLNPAATVNLYFDTDAAIYLVEKHPKYYPVIAARLAGYPGNLTRIVSSQLIVLECSVQPLRHGNLLLQTAYEQFFSNIERFEIDLSVLRKAAELRAVTKTLRTPDAIHAATALIYQCDAFFTNDGTYRKVAGLPVAILDDFLLP